jgi:hypothetical protein
MNYIMGWDEGTAVEPDPMDLNRRGRLRKFSHPPTPKRKDTFLFF